MKHQKILSDIFDLLDPEIYNTAYFQELEKIILANCQIGDITFKVSPEIYDCLKEFDYPEDLGISSEFFLEIESDDFLLKISKDENGLYIVELNIQTEDLETINEYYFSTEIAIIETTQLKKKDGYYSSFDCEVYYYFGNKLSTPFNIYVNGYKDMSFSKKFEMPQILANYFRKNFKKLSSLIAYYQETGQFSCLDPYLDTTDYASFLRPFKMSEIEDFIKKQFLYEIAGLLEDAIFNNDSFEELPIDEIDYVLDNLIRSIGTDGTCIMSHNIYQSICMYILGYIDSLDTKGFIIKKTDDGFHLFAIAIEGYKVLAIELNATEEEIKSLYDCNPLNKDIPELEGFFNTTRGR